MQGTIAGLKAAGDIAKGFMELKSMADVQGKVIELQSAILAAQSSALSANAEQAAMVNEISELKEEITNIKAWETQKQRYQLHSPFAGAVVYALKESMSNSEPPHYICTKCYEDGKRMILQPRVAKDAFTFLACPHCKAELHSMFHFSGKLVYV